MNTMPYSAVRPHLRVGDVIGCQGLGLISRAIRWVKGGEWDWSHVAIVIRDTSNEGTGRVEVLEALSKGGIQQNYLSKIYEADHGNLFWIKLDCDVATAKDIMELGAQIVERKTGYDFRSTWLAALSPIFVDVKKFNCSEVAWYLLTQVGRLLKRFDKEFREIAPVPGDFPTWSGVEPIMIDMD